ncbi:3-hydroxybutyryl-CoA dehydrogenase [Haloechinothrix halophila]|uniref:3-hydroxybutyryl-CoA dehydrogenase n=1 Tax=Haloechinothrix halophila TaxID=1069073 RepID=UPI000424ECEE|nr:3-hydroxybutyryl-CoA dehydrogenase [Haloechinothrix halophila]
MTETITRVGVVGCGVMGASIAEICARAGLDVRMAVRSASSQRAGLGRIIKSLDRSVRKQQTTELQRDDILAQITLTTELADLADRELVIEAAVEHGDVKAEIFTNLDKIVQAPDAILASNTSSIPVTRLGSITTRPQRVLGMHFFNPATRMPLVELVETLVADEEAVTRAERFLSTVLEKHVIRTRDRAGFVVNALLIPYILSAIRMFESGFASAMGIDRAMKLGCAHPMGPLELADLIGLDVVLGVAEALHAEFREPHYCPPPLLVRMVDSGLLGNKTGHGFHNHTG